MSSERIHMIKPSAELIQGVSPYQKIELAGRNCYQSDSAFTEETAQAFCSQMTENRHYAMLEHGVFVFKIEAPISATDMIAHTSAVLSSIKYAEWSSYILSDSIVFYVAISLRVILENARLLSDLVVTSTFGSLIDKAYPGFNLCDRCGFLKELDENLPVSVKLMSQEEMYEELPEDAILKCAFLSVRYITDRGVSHELVRHRPASFAQESTRYCNYSKDKYKGRVTFVEPSGYETWSEEQKEVLISSLAFAEEQYLKATESGLKAQQARAILPNATKTDIVVTMNVKELIHFFKLRYYGVTGDPHPDMLAITTQSLPLVVEELERYKFGKDIAQVLQRKKEFFHN